MEKKKRSVRKIRFSLLGLVLTLLLVMPVAVALAETPTVVGVVATDVGYAIGDTYQRHSFNAEGLHWVFYATDSAIYYTSSTDANTWDTPTKFDDYECGLGEACCNGTVFSLWYDVDENFVDIAYLNVSNTNEALYYDRGTPSSSGAITWDTPQTAANATADTFYSHPSICVNTLDYPFITYMTQNLSDCWADLATSTTNDSTWGFATNSTISSASTFNFSVDVMYPSVVPVTEGNVSLMVVFANGSDYLLAQNYADYDVDTDTWDYPETVQFPLPATSTLLTLAPWLHTEVAWSGNVSNPDDVYLACVANDSVLGEILLYDRYGDTGSPWSSDDALTSGDYFPAISIRNALGDLTLTMIENTAKVKLYSSDYTQATQSWSAVESVYDATGSTSDLIQSDYDNAGTDEIGVLFNNHPSPFDLDYGCYGCEAIPSTVPESVTTMAWIVILVFGALICLLLLGYGAYEVSRGRGNMELVKVGVIGFITFVIAAIIVANLL